MLGCERTEHVVRSLVLRAEAAAGMQQVEGSQHRDQSRYEWQGFCPASTFWVGLAAGLYSGAYSSTCAAGEVGSCAVAGITLPADLEGAQPSHATWPALCYRF